MRWLLPAFGWPLSLPDIEWPFRGQLGQVSFHLIFALTHATAVLHHLVCAAKELLRAEDP